MNIEEILSDANKDKHLYEVFDECAAWYARTSIDDMEFTHRTYVCLESYMDHPLAQPTGCHWTVDELLEITVGQLQGIRNFNRDCVVEVLEKLDKLIKERKV